MAGIICSYANNCIPSNPLIRCKISNAYFPYFNQSHDSLHLLHCICYAFSVRPLSSHRNIDTYLNIMGSGMLHSSSSLCPQMKKLPQISILSLMILFTGLPSLRPHSSQTRTMPGSSKGSTISIILPTNACISGSV